MAARRGHPVRLFRSGVVATSAPFTHRATASAIAAGVVILASAPLADVLNVGEGARGVVAACVCAALVWLAAKGGLDENAAAHAAAIARLDAASAGDLDAPVPAETLARLPELGRALDELFRTVSARVRRVEHSAAFDAVTALPNRETFRRLAGDMIGSDTRSAAGATLFFIDLDRFKAVNDSHGHAVGDQVLAEVARRLTAVVATQAPAGTLLGRLAGDEFTMLCPSLADADAAQRLGDALLAALCAPFHLAVGEISVGASIGIALWPAHGADLHELMRAADAAMYRSKAGGRAQVSRFSAGLATEIAEREQLDRELGHALAREEFVLAYQPQVTLSDGTLIGLEALLRWRHPQLGLRTPAAFLDRAERNGQILAIGEWSARELAATAARWTAEGRPGRFSFNLGARQTETPRFLRVVEDVFRAAGAPLDRLELEIGESVAMRCPPEVIDALERLRGEGVRVALDDFGTGESNVQRLRALPIDRIKIDRALVRGITADAGARAILQALVGLIHGLGFQATAEGVESEAQLDVLRVLGCDGAQGYAIAHPMPLDELASWIAADRSAGDRQRLWS